MQAVFLNNNTCERVHPVRIRKDNPDAEPFYEGMDEPLREIHDIWIKQYLRVDGVYFPRIAFEANEDENIEFDSNQEYEILSRKTDGYIYFIPENFNIYTVGDAQFFYRKNGKKQKIRIHVASMLDGETYEKILKELTAITDQKSIEKYGGSKMYFAPPIDYDKVMKKIPYGKVITVGKIREYFAELSSADFTEPITAGIFVSIVAWASYQRSEDETPYWRTLKANGELNAKYPNGIEAQKEKLEAEGHTIIQKGRKNVRYYVKDYENSLFDLK